MDEDVGGAGEAADDVASARMVEVDAYAFLVAVVGEIGDRLAAPLGGEAADVVAGARAFELDYGRAEVAE